jgi:magnesium chelatase subunit I
MDNETSNDSRQITEPEQKESFKSLKDIIDHVTGKKWQGIQGTHDSGLAEVIPFPFLALVGQVEMKYALLLALINPAIGGVLLIGPRGTGKTTAIRGLIDLVPEIPRSLCYYGCLPEDVETGGIDAVCPNCAQKYAAGEPLAAMDKIRLVELPLNSQLDDVVGVVDEDITGHERLRLHRGILAHADRNLLLIDEVNLLTNDVVDVVMDAAAYGSYIVRRGATAATYKSRFVLIGTMNPEEGQLRSQIMDRFGLRIVVKGLIDPTQRQEAYQRVHAYITNPRQVMLEYNEETKIAQTEVQTARDILPEVVIPEDVSFMALELIQQLKIDSLRAEVTLFEAARAFAALDGRSEVCRDDIHIIAPMALRMRRSAFIEKYLAEQSIEEDEIKNTVTRTLKNISFTGDTKNGKTV